MRHICRMPHVYKTPRQRNFNVKLEKQSYEFFM